jgi:hypothetical protein
VSSARPGPRSGAAAYVEGSELGGALAQLSLNLGCIVLAGISTLVLLRYFFRRRLLRAV